jgi:enoyl-CoA hydratase/carnithine racemase
MDYQHILVQRIDHIATVTFNRPQRANALNYAHLAEIEAAALSFRDDADTRVVIFTGAGRHFSSGADLTDPGKEYLGPMSLRRRRYRIGERAIAALYDMDQITIAAWNGAAMGGGACIATALDFRIGAGDCFMQYPEVDIGVNLMWRSLPLIVHLAGPARAKRLVAGGEHIAAQTLLDWGILDDLVAPDVLLETAHQLAEFYVAKPPVAVQMIKRSVNQLVSAQDVAVMHMDVDQNLLAQTSKDRARAIDAYLNKTPPIFTGE